MAAEGVLRKLNLKKQNNKKRSMVNIHPGISCLFYNQYILGVLFSSLQVYVSFSESKMK